MMGLFENLRECPETPFMEHLGYPLVGIVFLVIIKSINLK
jgi:hypothetical protein